MIGLKRTLLAPHTILVERPDATFSLGLSIYLHLVTRSGKFLQVDRFEIGSLSVAIVAIK